MLPPTISLSNPLENEFYNFKQNIKNYSVGLGLSELQEYNFLGVKEEKICDKNFFSNVIPVLNPQSVDYKYLRPFSLVSSLYSISTNIKYFPNAKTFEISKNFLTVGNTVLESDCYGFALYNSKSKSQLTDLILEGKGIIEALFEKFGISQEDYFTSNILPDNLNTLYSPYVQDGRTICFYANSNELIASIFIPENKILDSYSISIENKQPVVVLGEINLNEFFRLVKREVEFKALPKYPASIKDLSILVPGHTLIQDIYLTIQKSGSKNLFDVDLFDVYDGLEKAGEKKSISFHLIFRSEDHTLTDKEVNEEFDKIVSAVKQQG
jgi:phenylalanyl-tRNA synthetase beta chain